MVQETICENCFVCTAKMLNRVKNTNKYYLSYLNPNTNCIFALVNFKTIKTMYLGKKSKNKHNRIFFIEVQMIRWAYETELKKGKVGRNITFNQLHSIVNRHFPIGRVRLASILEDNHVLIKLEDGKLKFINRHNAYSLVEKFPTIFADLSQLKRTNYLKDKNLRCDFVFIAFLIYAEFRRRHFSLASHENNLLVENGEIRYGRKFSPISFMSQKTMAKELGWSTSKVAQQIKKIKRLFGVKAYTSDTQGERQGRKYPNSQSYSLNLPPLEDMEAIVNRKMIALSRLKKNAFRKKMDKPEWTHVRNCIKRKNSNRYRFMYNTQHCNSDCYLETIGIIDKIDKLQDKGKYKSAQFFLKLLTGEDAANRKRIIPTFVIDKFKEKLKKSKSLEAA